jgi:hypothetical protein
LQREGCGAFLAFERLVDRFTAKHTPGAYGRRLACEKTKLRGRSQRRRLSRSRGVSWRHLTRRDAPKVLAATLAVPFRIVLADDAPTESHFARLRPFE